MTTIYFIRHAESDISVLDDNMRPLTAKGHEDCALVTKFLKDKGIDVVLSSPYKRSADTVAGFADSIGLQIELVEDFRERKVGGWAERFKEYSQKQWEDFSFKQPGGESLFEVQLRNIAALEEVLVKYKDKNIAVGTHGTALSVIINYYDSTYNYDDFWAMVGLMPWAVKMDFDGNACVCIEKIDLFKI